MIIAVAETCHNFNRVYCASIGDNSQPRWKHIRDHQYDSVLSGVEFHLLNPDATDSSSHEEWLAYKKADGWVYGETKDEEKKTHPCMVPFDELPPEQQKKDANFKMICDTLLHGH